jgi:hypothetical protein
MAAPIPCCAPVTSATLPANFMQLLPNAVVNSTMLED